MPAGPFAPDTMLAEEHALVSHLLGEWPMDRWYPGAEFGSAATEEDARRMAREYFEAHPLQIGADGWARQPRTPDREALIEHLRGELRHGHRFDRLGFGFGTAQTREEAETIADEHFRRLPASPAALPAPRS